MCKVIDGTSLGTVLTYGKTEETWGKEFKKRKEIDLLKAWAVDDDDLRVSEFAEDVLGVFSSVLSLHNIL